MILFKNNETGENLQIGTTCVKKFFGFSKSLKMCEYFCGLEEFLKDIENDEDYRECGSGDIVFNTETFVEISKMLTKSNGYIKSSDFEMSENAPKTTKDMVIDYFGNASISKIEISQETKNILEYIGAHESHIACHISCSL